MPAAAPLPLVAAFMTRICLHPVVQGLDPVAWQKFVDILGGDEESIQEVADLFLQESQSVGQSLLQAVEERDAETTRRMAHRLKSSARQLGALALSDVAHQLEEAGNRGELDRAQQLAPAFRRELEDARNAVAQQIVV